MSNPRTWPCWTYRDILHRDIAIAAWDVSEAQIRLTEAQDKLRAYDADTDNLI